MIIIDGSQGEGGGQILRSALSLSACTGQPFRIRNIRKNRSRPGLMRQHLTCIRATEEVCGGKATDAHIGSTELTFSPGDIRGGSYNFNIGTAGSTSLVFQTVLPALLAADEPSCVELSGGTHNAASPPFEFIDEVFLPMIKRSGGIVSATLQRRGFYPAGGGRWTAFIEPLLEPRDLTLEGASATPSISVEAATANIPESIATRELATAKDMLGLPDDALTQKVYESDGPGNVVLIRIDWPERREIVTGFGKHGVSAETVAKRACAEAKSLIAHGGVVGPHLADQLLLPMALGAGGQFETAEPSAHFVSSVDVIKAFLDVEITIKDGGTEHYFIKVERISRLISN
ncbi:MAG: RNA 3'-terminal phosphate cyclase [Pseudomonadota bacterium]